jgi:electron transport complex protein RnfD
MWTVVTALLPAAVAGVVLFGRPALVVIISSILAAVLAEALSQLAMGRRITAHDGSAVVTGLLLALSVPPELPWWMAAFGAAFAIIIAKQVFGGLGHNVFNPALAGRAFLLASWPSAMMTWKWPAGSLSWAGGSADAVAGATVLEMAKRGLFARYGISIPYSQLFMGNIAGSLGETSALALLIGAVFLLAFRVIDWRIPLGYLGTLAALALLAGQDPVLHLLSGGVLLGAFFMATDYVTTPVTPGGRFFFGLGCGVLTFLIRLYGGYPEGVTYAILLMNAAAPLLEKATIPKRFGEVRANG